MNSHIKRATSSYSPLDCHSFKIAEPTRYYFIRFTDHFFRNEDGLTNYQDWFDRIAYILANYNKVPGDIIESDAERDTIIRNIKAIHREYLSMDDYSHSVIAGTIAAILSILARNIEKKYVSQASAGDSRFGEVLRFINTNISNNERLRASDLADRFGIARSYFSEYFKKQAGISLANYITKSKLQIVQTKVLHSDLTVKEVAYQLGFTDSSHLARAFKKAYGMTIGEFKNCGGKICCDAM